MDDVQDNYLNYAQKAVINLFKNQQLPLTIGIIANEFGHDNDIVQFVKDSLQVPGFNLEVANHGWNHEEFPTFTLAQQNELLSESLTRTLSDLNGYITSITTFIAPYNEFNDNTITALKSQGFRVIASDISFYYPEDGNTRQYPGTDPLFRDYPAGSSTTDLTDSYKISAEESFAMIQTQMNAKSFSAIMMHYEEFTKSQNGQEFAVIDQTQLDDLQRLIDMCKAAQYTFTTLGGLTDCLSDNTPATTGAHTPVTTGALTPATTGARTPATTGARTPATTGKTVPSTTGKAVPSTTGHANPSTTGSTSTSCSSSGYMRCMTSETYQTCSANRDGSLSWGPSQSCQPSLTCHPSGNYIYCY
jgi:peptidoglycan/xylan/chitin deacetylase (PgdA/CDA1 family)